MSAKNSSARVALKYCGSCNPYVDLTRIARHLAQVAAVEGVFELVPLADAGVEVVVVLCGCPRACGDKEEVRAGVERCLVVAGESVDGNPVAEECLPEAVERQLKEMLGR